MRSAIAVLFVLQIFAGSLPALAGQPMDPEKHALILRLMDTTSTGAQRYSVLFAEFVASQVYDGILTSKPDVPRETLYIVREEVKAMIADNTKDMAADIIAVYARHFTKSELRVLVAFYETTTGQKARDVMPLILKESAAITSDKLTPLIPKLRQRILQRLKDAGYE